MKQWMSVWILEHGLLQVLQYQLIIVPLTDIIGNNTAVIEVLNRTQKSLLSITIGEMGYISNPLLVWVGGCEIPL